GAEQRPKEREIEAAHLRMLPREVVVNAVSGDDHRRRSVAVGRRAGGVSERLHDVGNDAYLLVERTALETRGVLAGNLGSELLEDADQPFAAERLLQPPQHQLREERVLLREDVQALVGQPPGVTGPASTRRPDPLLDV